MGANRKLLLFYTLFYIAIPAAFLFLFYYFKDEYAFFIWRSFIYPLRIDKLPFWLFITISGSVGVAPMAGLVVFYFQKVSSYKDTLRAPTVNPLESLESARKSLKKSVQYLNKLEKDITSNMRKHRELSELVDTLDSISREKIEDLQKKIRAIEYLNRSKEYWRIGLGFILGIIASLIASAIWDVASRN